VRAVGYELNSINELLDNSLLWNDLVQPNVQIVQK